MLDIIVTCYDVEEIRYQKKLLKNSNLPYNFYFITNFEDKGKVNLIKQETNLDIYWVDQNPGKHLGALYLAYSGISLINNPYILHYHADMIWEDINIISQLAEKFIHSNKKVSGIPRQWLFNDDGIFQDNKSLPFRSELFFISSDLYKKIFELTQYENIKNRYIYHHGNNLPPHLEPYIYAGLELNGVDFQKDIYYLEDVKRMKTLYGNNILYYDITFENTRVQRLK